MVFCTVVAVVMLESWVARCVHREEDVAWLESSNILFTVHTSCYPTRQHHNSYNRTENHRQWNAVRSPDDGRKDAWNMLRNNWLPINHYLLHLVGLALIYSYLTQHHIIEGLDPHPPCWDLEWHSYSFHSQHLELYGYVLVVRILCVSWFYFILLVLPELFLL